MFVRIMNFLGSWFKRWGHLHEWDVHKEGDIVNDRGLKIGSYYDLRCKTCGAMKRRNFIT